jgi:hypothetical protein
MDIPSDKKGIHIPLELSRARQVGKGDDVDLVPLALQRLSEFMRSDRSAAGAIQFVAD